MLIIKVPERLVTVYARDQHSSRARLSRFEQFYLGKILHEGHYKDMGGPQSGPLILRKPASNSCDVVVQTSKVQFEMDGQQVVLK
jgi:hypothetical protein